MSKHLKSRYIDRRINYNHRHMLRKVRVFRRQAWKNTGWMLGRNGMLWCQSCDQFGNWIGDHR